MLPLKWKINITIKTSSCRRRANRFNRREKMSLVSSQISRYVPSR